MFHFCNKTRFNALFVLAINFFYIRDRGVMPRRFIAVTQPIKYAKHKNSKRVHVMLALTWIISVAISSPIALGMNYTELLPVPTSMQPMLMTMVTMSRDMLSGTTPNVEHRRRPSARSTTPTSSSTRPWDPSTSRACLLRPGSSSTCRGLFLHPVRGDGPALLAHLSHDTPANSQVGRRRRRRFRRFVGAAPEVDADDDGRRRQAGADDRRTQVSAGRRVGHQQDRRRHRGHRRAAVGRRRTGSRTATGSRSLPAGHDVIGDRDSASTASERTRRR